MDASVLIVIPTLGRRLGWLTSALQSIELQVAASVEMLVVAPSGASEVRALSARHGAGFMPVDEPGLSRAINAGWEGATAKYLAWLGDDDLLAPGSLAATVAALERRPEASLAFGQVRYIDGEGRTLWLQRTGRWVVPYMHIGKNLVPQQGSLFRATDVRAAGGLDESLKAAMDQKLIATLATLGPAVYLPREVGAFRLHESNITVTKSGPDESDELRAQHFPRTYPALRRVTKASDRLIYGTIRRLPAPAPPTFGTVGPIPYGG